MEIPSSLCNFLACGLCLLFWDSVVTYEIGTIKLPLRKIIMQFRCTQNRSSFQPLKQQMGLRTTCRRRCRLRCILGNLLSSSICFFKAKPPEIKNKLTLLWSQQKNHRIQFKEEWALVGSSLGKLESLIKLQKSSVIQDNTLIIYHLYIAPELDEVPSVLKHPL